MALGTPPLLAGKASRDIKLLLDRQQSAMDARNQALQMFSNLFAVSSDAALQAIQLTKEQQFINAHVNCKLYSTV
jgi:hypothetical protein